ncbi:MAG: toll/interleukin-1 receptor domain-containing protein [Prevotella sp.]|nr:toll/interleukin-1 receptor domain-containing protein [Prevotella sp.]
MSRKSRKFNTKKFIKDVLNDKYALVIGNEIILDSKIEPTRDVHQYILHKVNENSNVQYESYNEIALYMDERINPVRQLVESEEIQFKSEYVSAELMQLLQTKLFTTILTTTTDGYMEAALRKVWGKELRVINIYDKETVDGLQDALKNCRKGRRYTQPTLIYVFGKMEEDWSMDYFRTDADAILLIEKWMRMHVEANNEMLDFIKSKRLLALGCKFENWYFRFFWYVLTGTIDGNRNFDGPGEVAFELNTTEQSEKKLLSFLDRTNICVLGDAVSFIKDITQLLTDDSEESLFRQQVVENRRRGGVFISYCSKDALTASQLFFRLCEYKYDVWLDNARLYGGDNYENEIADAISEAKVFIAVLSPSIAKHLGNDDTDHYYNKEWRMAQQFNDKHIIPLAVNGYDLRSDVHKVFETIVNQQPSGINLMDADGFQKLTKAINEHLL